ncbi:MAG: zinc-ribbon domain-containing protein [Magnetococcales bacterium]|nr:zinc-ribbon domain-containing protein [Magnetococcales bacterium]
MIVQCENCSSRFDVEDKVLLPAGRKLKCSMCKHVFFQLPPTPETQKSTADAAPDASTVAPTAAKSASGSTPTPADEPRAEPSLDDLPTPATTGQEKEGLKDDDLDLDLSEEDGLDGPAKSEPEPSLDLDMDTDLEEKPDLDADDLDLNDVDDLLLDDDNPDAKPDPGQTESGEKSLESLLDEMNAEDLTLDNEEDAATVLSQLSNNANPGDDVVAEGDEEDREPVFDDLAAEAQTDEDLKEIVLDDFPEEDPLNDIGDDEVTSRGNPDLSKYEEVNLDDETSISSKQAAFANDDADLAGLAMKDEAPAGKVGIPLATANDRQSQPETDDHLTEEEEDPPALLPFATPRMRQILLWTALFLGGIWIFGMLSRTEWFEYRIHAMRNDIHLAFVESHWRTTRDGEPMLLLEGKLHNATQTGQRARVIRVSLLDKENNLLRAVRIVPGRILKNDDFDLSDQSLRTLLDLQSDTQQVKTIPTVKAGSDIGFQAIFLQPPQETVRFKVDIDEPSKEAPDKNAAKNAKGQAEEKNQEKKSEKPTDGKDPEKKSGGEEHGKKSGH